MSWEKFLLEREEEFASTQFNFPKELATKIVEWGKENIPDEELDAKGREEEVHVTVLFGLHANTPDPVKKIVEGTGALKATLGKISVFELDDCDVVKIDVKSRDLHLMHNRLARLPHTSEHKDYKPHVTVAYVEKGRGEKFSGMEDFEGTKLDLKDFVFSSKAREHTKITLGGEK